MDVTTSLGFQHLASVFFSLWRSSFLFIYQTFIHVSQVAEKLIYEMRLSLWPLVEYLTMIRADKRKTLMNMLEPSFTRTRNQSCGDGGMRIRISSLRCPQRAHGTCKSIYIRSSCLNHWRFPWIFCQLEVLHNYLPSSSDERSWNYRNLWTRHGLEHGADVLEANNNYGKTALQVAAEEGHGEVVELLREHGAKWICLVAFV